MSRATSLRPGGRAHRPVVRLPEQKAITRSGEGRLPEQKATSLSGEGHLPEQKAIARSGEERLREQKGMAGVRKAA